MRKFLVLLLVLLSTNLYSQVKIKDATIIVDSVFLILKDSTPNVIVKVNQTGGIFTKNASSYVNIGAKGSVYTYTIPFVASNSDTIPLRFAITSPTSGSSISFNSFEVDDDNLPLPTASYIGGTLTDSYRTGIDRFWKIVPLGFINSFPQSQVTFTYSGLDLIGNTIFESSLQVKRFNNTSNDWNDKSYASLVNARKATVSLTSAADFYPVWTLQYTPSLLPLDLLSFSTSCSEGFTLVEWKTTNEVDIDYYAIETSKDAREWTQVATEFAREQLVNVYSKLIDNSGYFRLVTVNLDGSREISNLSHSRCGSAALSWKNESDLIKFNMPVDRITVYNLLGQQIETQRFTDHIQIPDSKQAYIVFAEIDGDLHSFKIVKNK